jgi:hypothetical protein
VVSPAYGNEYPDSINGGEFFEELKDSLLAFQDGLCSMELGSS